MNKLSLLAALALSSASLAHAGEQQLMHCFAFTPIASATPDQWDAFWKATDALPKNIPAIKMVWYGKLRAPLNQFRVDADTAKKFTPENPKVEGAAVTRVRREYGVCMAMESADALKTYTQNPYHKVWSAAYEKVRVAGTTTFDIIGQ
jgi:hypothetical protein